MSTVNPLAREISAKIVYYGPGLSGKTTSLQRVYDFVRPESRGQLISLNTEGDRTLFFDFLPLRVEQVRGLALRLQLYTVPGQVFYDATRKLVLNGADGVVFVADSQPAAHDRNMESMENLRENLGELGIALDAFPLVIEYNKRDLPNVMPLELLRRDLNPRGVPDFETVASRGVNIMPALKEITRLVMVDLRSRQPAPRKVMAPLETKGSHASEFADQVSAAADAGARTVTAWPPVQPPGPATQPPPARAGPALLRRRRRRPPATPRSQRPRLLRFLSPSLGRRLRPRPACARRHRALKASTRRRRSSSASRASSRAGARRSARWSTRSGSGRSAPRSGAPRRGSRS